MTSRTETKTSTHGSEPIVIDAPAAGDTAAEAVGSTIDTLTAFASTTQRVGAEIADSTTAAFRDGLELSAKVQGAVLDASRDAFGAFSFSASPLESWNRVWDTSTRAYTDYAHRVASAADEVTAKIREAVSALSEEVSGGLSRISR